MKEQPKVKPTVFCPRGAVKSLMHCRDLLVMIDGPAGTGKSRGVLEKLYICAANYPRCRILICRKTRTSMTTSTLVTWEEKVLPENSPVSAGASRSTRRTYRFPNGSEIDVCGLDNPDRIMSTEYDLIAVFESTEIDEDDLEKLMSRLRNGKMPYQQLILDCNPAGNGHHLKRRADDNKLTRLPSRHEDNPMLHDGKDWTDAGRKYLDVLGNLTGARRERLLKGHWASSEGLVFDNWDASVHLIDRFEIPASWRRIRSIDFGYTNPFVCQWWAIDPDGVLYRYREVYGTRRLVEDWAKVINQLSEGENIESTVSDHDAEDRATLERHGIQTVAADKTVGVGIQAVTNRLRTLENGKPRLYLLRDSLYQADGELEEKKKPTCTEMEIENYSWSKSKTGRAEKEEPIKVDDHGCDAMRYAVMHVDQDNGYSAAVVDVDSSARANTLPVDESDDPRW